MGITSKEIWNSFFDVNLEKYMNESDIIRDLAMVFHVMQIKFNEVRSNIVKIQKQTDEQKSIIHEKSKANCTCKRNFTNLEDSDITKLEQISKTRDEIIVLSEDSPVRKKTNEIIINLDTPKQNNNRKSINDESLFDDSLNFLDNDMFNQQISELDLENINHSIINTSVNEPKNINKKDKGLSPKLNKKKSVNRAIKVKLSKSLNNDDSFDENETITKERTPNSKIDESCIVCETPDLLDSKSLKIIKKKKTKPLSMKTENIHLSDNVLKPKCLNSPKKTRIKCEFVSKQEKRPLDDDQTIFNPSTSKEFSEGDEIDIDMLLSEINKSPFNTPSKKCKMSVKENVCDTSYKILSIQKEVGTKRQYKEVVRKKSERANLPGWDCEDCAKFYDKLDLNDSEMKKIKNACSRHKSKHQFQEILTPAGYWNPDFTIQTEEL